MAERVETIRLTAQVANYISGMQAAQRATQQTATAAQKLANQGQAFTTLGRTLVVAGAAIAAGVVLAVKTFADFDAQMSQVKTLSGATAEEMTRLAEAAETLGQKIGISASQAADAEIELVKAGVSVSDILGGALQGSLQLAAAGQIDVADATEIATIALTQFGLKGADIPHVADLLSAGADKALGGVQDLGEALKSGGLVASQFGVSLEETVGTLSAFANAGLIGETAGTDLRQLLLKLADPSAEAADRMKQLGISIYDTSGKFVGLSNLSGQLHDKLGTLTEAQRNSALSLIFGSRAIAGANVLYKEGASGISKWTAEVNDSGFAAKQAAGKMDNLNGDISKLGAAFQSDLIDAGSSANGALRELVQSLTEVVRGFALLPAPVQGTVLAVGALVAVVALAGGTFLTLVPKIAATRAALITLSADVPALRAALSSVSTFLTGPWGIALAAAALGVQALGNYLDSLQSSSLEIQSALIGASSAADIFATATKGKDVKYLSDVTGQLKDLNNVLDQAAAQENPLNRFTGSQYFGSINTLRDVGAQLATLSETNAPAAAAAFDLLAAKTDGSKKKLWELLSTMSDYRDELIRQGLANGTYSDAMSDSQKKVVLLAAAQDTGAAVTQTAADKYQSAATAAANLSDQISQLIDTVNTANGVGQDAVASNASYQKALADISDYADKARKKVDGYTLGVNESTAAGSANVAMLADLAKKNEDAAKAQYALDGNTDTYIATLTAGHQAVVDHAIALGATADQAQAIADKVAAIPTDKQVQILVDTKQADDALDGTTFKLNNLINAFRKVPQVGVGTGLGILPTHAAGGYTTAGAHLAVLGELGTEFVSTAATVAKPANRAALEYMNAGGTVSAFAQGGYVGPPPYSGSSNGFGPPEIPVNIRVTGETDPAAFAALAGQAVAVRVRGIVR